MFFLARPDTQAVHLLADLLETIEVAADELMDKKLEARDIGAIRAMSEAEVECQLADLRKFIGRLRELELSIVAKLGQARDKARAVARNDWRLRPIMMLFTAGTQAFADRFEAEPRVAAAELDGEGQIFPYLRSRGLIMPMTTSYDGSAELLVTDGFRLFGAMTLRDLIERCEATLNALDAHYDLFDLENDEAEEAAVDLQPTESQAAAPIAAVAIAEGASTAEVPPVAETAPPAASQTPAAVAEVAEATVSEPLAAAQETAIKGLTERLAELKAEPGAPAKDAPAEEETEREASAA